MVFAAMKEQNMTDDPPYSRLFVVYNRKDPLSETELRNDFSPYGDVQDIFMVKDKGTGESKGVAYVKYPKMSEAALAMEKLNNTPIKGHTGVYKVYIAKSRGEARGPDHDDPDRYLRLFVMVPKSATEEDIRQYFKKFGDVTSVKLLRHKDSNESKGLGYVTYARVYDAARAAESGENEYGFKAVIARPKEKNQPADTSYSSYSNNGPRSSNNDLILNGDCFHASVSSKLDKDQIFRLFDIAPGLRNIQITGQNMFRTEIVATYNSALAAEYALNKLQGLEYPLGEFICVESKGLNNSGSGASSSYTTSSNNISTKRDYRGEHITEQRSASPADPNREVNQKLGALTKALSDATALLKTAGISTENLGFEDTPHRWTTSSYCNFQLPTLQKVLPKSAFNENQGMRLFIVGHPSAPPLDALYDVYCRFGNFAGASILQRKNYGYLYYTTVESAQKAIEATDEKLIAGMSIKILPAEPKGEPGSKRKKIEHS